MRATAWQSWCIDRAEDKRVRFSETVPDFCLAMGNLIQAGFGMPDNLRGETGSPTSAWSFWSSGRDRSNRLKNSATILRQG